MSSWGFIDKNCSTILDTVYFPPIYAKFVRKKLVMFGTTVYKNMFTDVLFYSVSILFHTLKVTQ